uniref:CASC1 C-terminal domain-containing protein n=1 Tax=Glossina brevipalpis TaxID=37001 RepID=A0A1A9WZK0_9MUSC
MAQTSNVKKDQPRSAKYAVIRIEEVKGHKQKYAQILKEAKTCVDIVEAAKLICEQENDEQLKAKKWNLYANCDSRPKVDAPPKVRSYNAKLKFSENENKKQTINWLFTIDEHTILAQTYKQDLTRRALSKKQPQLGVQYDKMISDCLEISRRINAYLQNNKATAKVKTEVLMDIIELEKQTQREINEALNTLTYRVLSSGDAFMNSLDGISEEHCFSGDNFRIHIWSLKNVPVRFTHLDEPRMMLNLHNLGVFLHVPFSMLRLQLCIQAVHMNFDNLSEHAKSFKRKPCANLQNLLGGIQDLPAYVKHEYEIVTRMQQKVRKEILDKYHSYKLTIENIEKERNLKKKNKNKKIDEIVIPPKPQYLADNQYPDVFNQFLEKEQRQYESFLDIVYNPATLDLSYDEINLRKFIILNGIYQINSVQKPMCVNFGNRGMIWHTDDHKLIVEKNFHIPSNLRSAPSVIDTQSASRFSRLQIVNISNDVEFMSPIDIMKKDIDARDPLFVLIFYLPDYLCYWNEPIVCHYEEVQEEAEIFKSKEKNRDEKIIKILNTFQDELEGEILDKLNEFILSNVSLHTPRPNYFESTLSTTRILKSTPPLSPAVLNIQDFPLDLPLTNDQVKLIQQLCVPQILSSYKFPKDIKDDKQQNFQKVKRQKGTLLRSSVKPEKDVDLKYSFGRSQNNPERIFNVFDAVRPFHITNILHPSDDVLPNRPKTFYQLVKVLLLIKNLSYFKFHGILRRQQFQLQINWKKKKPRKNIQLSRPSYPKVSKDFKSPTDKNINDPDSPLLKRRYSMNKVSGRRDSSSTRRSLPKNRQGSRQLIVDSGLHSEGSFDKPENIELVTYSHWTTKHIKFSSFNREKKMLIIKTDRLGFFGFACNRYEHFPFKYWAVRPSKTDPENEVMFTLETQHVTCVLYITEHGISGYVSEPFQKHAKGAKKYLVIKDPVRNLTELKKRFEENYLNIFADRDACFYIENGYFCVKHLATEMHTYCCIVLNSIDMEFRSSEWNRFAQRRDIILLFNNYKQPTESNFQLLITPEEGVTFVDVDEECSNNIAITKLRYKPTWRNIDVSKFLFANILKTILFYDFSSTPIYIMPYIPFIQPQLNRFAKITG